MNAVICHFASRFLAVLFVGLLAVTGCSSSSAQRIQREPLTVLRDPQRPLTERESAIDSAWRQAQKSPADKARVRGAFKDMIWSAQVPTAMRKRMYDYLANDSDPAGVEDTRAMTRLMLPREPSREMVLVLCQTAAAKQWTDCIPALIRSYSRSVPLVKNEDRAERIALVRLSGDRPLVETVFAVFLNPPEEDPDSPADFRARTRADAYEVLGKLDVTGEYRRRLLEDPSLASSKDDIVGLLRRTVAELKVIPVTGEELRWLERLADPKNARNLAWWTQCQAIVAQLPPEKLEGLHLRHIEAVRIASVYQPDLLAKSRSEFLQELTALVESRKTVQRSNEAQGIVRAAKEQLPFHEPKLAWADFLTIFLLDRGIHQREFLERLYIYAGLDKDDPTTEYGGLLLTLHNVGDGTAPTDTPGRIVAWLFPPRPGQRMNDQEFIAPEEMILSGDRALAHFHFHVNRARNSEVAGPSSADLDYATRSGRSCVVFTSVSSDELDVDYYQPDGVVIDLGCVAKK